MTPQEVEKRKEGGKEQENEGGTAGGDVVGGNEGDASDEHAANDLLNLWETPESSLLSLSDDSSKKSAIVNLNDPRVRAATRHFEYEAAIAASPVTAAAAPQERASGSSASGSGSRAPVVTEQSIAPLPAQALGRSGQRHGGAGAAAEHDEPRLPSVAKGKGPEGERRLSC